MIYWLLLFGLMIAIGLGVIGFSTYKFIFPPRIKDNNLPKGRPKNPGELGLPYEDAVVTGHGGVSIALWWLPQAQPAPIVVLAHGFAISKAMVLTFVKRFYEQGYQVLVMDHRAHGYSGGITCTYGFYERYDMLACLEWVSQKSLAQPIVLFGASMGSIVISMLLTLKEVEKFPIRAVILQSPYPDLPNMTRYIIRQHLGILEKLFTWPVVWLTEKNGNFQLDAVAPGSVLAHSSIPKLFILGEHDVEIPASFTRETFLLAAEPKEIIEFDAGHNDIHRKGADNYWGKIVTFIELKIKN